MNTENAIPQANRLEVVRRLVEAVAHGITDDERLGSALRLSSRHLGYYRQAAQVLGWLTRDQPPTVTTEGRTLLRATFGSVAEAAVMEHAIRASPAISKVAPDLFELQGPSLGTLSERIRKATALSLSTATRRAQTLLAWRDRVLSQRTSLFHGAEMPNREPAPEVSSPVISSEEKPTFRPEALSLSSLRLMHFKNFVDATLPLGPLTLVTGTNASGKSNIRDAFRFLHGISRGYTLAEIIGEKWIEGGVLQWKGLRGGTREATFRGAESFSLEAGFQVIDRGRARTAKYLIQVEPGKRANVPPRVRRERLIVEGRGQFVFDSHPDNNAPQQDDPLHLAVRLRKEGQRGYLGPVIKVINNRPALSQLLDHPEVRLPSVREHVRLALSAFQSMRFLDLSPTQMRIPSLPGQTVLGDQGENLSSVLQALCSDPKKKKALVSWLRELTPLDAVDFEFPADQTGKILVTLVEEGGQKTSAYSASDGTLRFLAMIAALLGPEPARFFFFEELENGIHPTRLHLLLRLIERQSATGLLQVVATTHSPSLLTALSEAAQKAAVLVYRLPGEEQAGIERIVNIPEASRNLRQEDLGKLLATGWLEDAVAFTSSKESKQ